VLQVPAPRASAAGRVMPPMGTLLFDLESDPAQEHPLQDAALERRMAAAMVRLMRQSDAPPEQYVRLGLDAPCV